MEEEFARPWTATGTAGTPLEVGGSDVSVRAFELYDLDLEQMWCVYLPERKGGKYMSIIAFERKCRKGDGNHGLRKS